MSTGHLAAVSLAPGTRRPHGCVVSSRTRRSHSCCLSAWLSLPCQDRRGFSTEAATPGRLPHARRGRKSGPDSPRLRQQTAVSPSRSLTPSTHDQGVGAARSGTSGEDFAPAAHAVTSLNRGHAVGLSPTASEPVSTVSPSTLCCEAVLTSLLNESTRHRAPEWTSSSWEAAPQPSSR